MNPDDGLAPDQDAIDRAASALRSGQLVAFPTETVYGLGADAANESAVGAIYALKGRPADHPLIVHVSSAAGARRWGNLNAAASTLADAFWPGPMTLICPLMDGMPAYACAGHPTIGIRVPSHPTAQALLRAFELLGGVGVAGPSANRFGRISPTRASHVVDDYGAQAPLVLDGGAAKFGLESTIIDVSTDRIRLLRPGAIEAGAVAQALGLKLHQIEVPTIARSARSVDGVDIGDTPKPRTSLNSSLPAAAGTLAAHYAPHTSLRLVQAAQINAIAQSAHEQQRRLAIYSVQVPPLIQAQTQAQAETTLVWRRMPSSASVLAAQLYDDLRELDALNLDELIVERPVEQRGFAAIIDRLTRAQTGSGQSPAPHS
ncbi:MAG: L-threonylcarbamoyladenylate synthase [Burkholderiaceae bacterium]